MNLLLGYVLIINLIGLWIMYVDKQRARKRAYRIPELRLWTIAVFGGALGTTIGMYMFRHKTKHMVFRIGFPFLVILQIILVYYVVNEYLIS